MKVLVIGGGGREHALVWKILQSPLATAVSCVPGNAGTQAVAPGPSISAEDVDSLLEYARTQRFDLTVVGPEVPLAQGLVDRFEDQGLPCFGPTKAAAQIEASKTFAKELMVEAGIPTADYAVFDDPDKAAAYIETKGAPIVVKADGLAAGKGVLICRERDEALQAVDDIGRKRQFGEAGSRIVVEELLVGEEASFLALTDGFTVLPMATSQDHKPVFDDDTGPNTGGMGAYSPAPVVSPRVGEAIMEQVMVPAVRAMTDRGTPYRGILYAGLMIDPQGAFKVLEFNCRFGDPETQPLMMRLKSDLLPALAACRNGSLDKIELQWSDKPAVCVAMTSGGYPGSYTKGLPIEGLDIQQPNTMVFHAGTRRDEGKIVSSGGRVLGVTALGADIPDAIRAAYNRTRSIHFDGMHFRTDIGRKALSYL
ncbi:MAG: phosphoribosylamine--glycine ligase [Candidatus Alcyoniella australis]|nr:phosphoribosylamine--glycine ligase [Candidatus Alcyoniella australis]